MPAVHGRLRSALARAQENSVCDQSDVEYLRDKLGAFLAIQILHTTLMHVINSATSLESVVVQMVELMFVLARGGLSEIHGH